MSARLSKELCRLWGEPRGFPVEHDSAGKKEAATLSLDSSLAQRELGWRPRLSVREALNATTLWYRRWLAGEPAGEFCLADINAYACRTPADTQSVSFANPARATRGRGDS